MLLPWTVHRGDPASYTFRAKKNKSRAPVRVAAFFMAVERFAKVLSGTN
jgi:hypothetical protein